MSDIFSALFSAIRKGSVFSLAITLIVPNPAFALRQAGLEEQEINGAAVNDKKLLVTALTSDLLVTSAPTKSIPRTSPQPNQIPVHFATGLEEVESVVDGEQIEESLPRSAITPSEAGDVVWDLSEKVLRDLLDDLWRQVFRRDPTFSRNPRRFYFA